MSVAAQRSRAPEAVYPVVVADDGCRRRALSVERRVALGRCQLPQPPSDHPRRATSERPLGPVNETRYTIVSTELLDRSRGWPTSSPQPPLLVHPFTSVPPPYIPFPPPLPMLPSLVPPLVALCACWRRRQVFSSLPLAAQRGSSMGLLCNAAVRAR